MWTSSLNALKAALYVVKLRMKSQFLWPYGPYHKDLSVTQGYPVLPFFLITKLLIRWIIGHLRICALHPADSTPITKPWRTKMHRMSYLADANSSLSSSPQRVTCRFDRVWLQFDWKTWQIERDRSKSPHCSVREVRELEVIAWRRVPFIFSDLWPVYLLTDSPSWSGIQLHSSSHSTAPKAIQADPSLHITGTKCTTMQWPSARSFNSSSLASRSRTDHQNKNLNPVINARTATTL